MKITVTHNVELSDAEVDNIFMRRLEALKDGRWVREGKLWEEAYTSHRFDLEIGDHTHPDYDLVLSVQQLQTVLNDRKERRRGTARA